MKFQTKKLVLSALFMALTCVATMSIRIPTPGTGGYIHPGDAIVILSGALFGPVWGFLIAGIGSCLADLLDVYKRQYIRIKSIAHHSNCFRFTI